jgi:septal ring factor EnvC (AmiA/AmiB activator)
MSIVELIFKTLFTKYIKKEISKVMANLTEQIGQFRAALQTQLDTLSDELNEVKDKFGEVKSTVDTLKADVAALEAKVAEFDSIDLTDDIAKINASVDQIESISDSINLEPTVVPPVPEPPVAPAEPVVEENPVA